MRLLALALALGLASSNEITLPEDDAASKAEDVQVAFSPAFGDDVFAKPAFFGVVPFGQVITGRLIYSSPGNRDACAPIEPSAVRVSNITVNLTHELTAEVSRR